MRKTNMARARTSPVRGNPRLYSAWKPGDPVRDSRYTVIPDVNDLPRGGVRLNTTKLTPAASDAFSEAELAARLAAIAARVEREEPKTARRRTACWLCGDVSPAGNMIGAVGWHSRACPRHSSVCEVYCKACFEEWGWGDADE